MGGQRILYGLLLLMLIVIVLPIPSVSFKKSYRDAKPVSAKSIVSTRYYAGVPETIERFGFSTVYPIFSRDT